MATSTTPQPGAVWAEAGYGGRIGGRRGFGQGWHYRSLADRVLAGLRQGGRIVLVTGHPPVNLSSLAAALTEATAGKHTVSARDCVWGRIQRAGA
jgi:hypothetical protein